MKNYSITVNGVVYDVTVEEKNSVTSTTAAAPSPTMPPVPTMKKTETTREGGVKITSGAAGKVFKVEVSVGQHVEKGMPVFIVEAMKMEIPVVAPQAGKIVSINATVGDAVDAGEVLATMK